MLQALYTWQNSINSYLFHHLSGQEVLHVGWWQQTKASHNDEEQRLVFLYNMMFKMNQ